MIRFKNVTKQFGAHLALDEVSLHFEAKRTHILLGSSGCGKSTIIHLILGLLMADRGEVQVGETVVTPTTRVQLVSQMGYVVQEGGLYPHLTAQRNVTLPADVQRWSAARISERLHQLAQLVGFEDAILQHYPHELSGGQRQRVGLMRALMLDPPLLLLDEPLGALDPIVRAGLQDELKSIFSTLGKTVVMVTHDIREAAVLGDTITLMTEGRVVQHGTFSDLARHPSTPFVTTFLKAQKSPPDLQEFL